MKYQDIDCLDKNYCALALSIMYPIYPEEAFYFLHKLGKQPDGTSGDHLKEYEKKLMLKLYNRGVKCADLARLAGISRDGMYYRIRRYKEELLQLKEA